MVNQRCSLDTFKDKSGGKKWIQSTGSFKTIRGGRRLVTGYWMELVEIGQNSGKGC